MDNNLLALIAIAVLVSIVGLAALRGWTRRKIRTTAATRRETEVPRMLSEFGRSVVLQADTAATGALIDALPKRKPKPLSPGVWGINYVARDDVIIELRAVDGGSEVLVTQVREYLGFPQALPIWTTFSEKLVEAANSAGISTSRGAHVLQYRPIPANSLDNATWTLAP